METMMGKRKRPWEFFLEDYREESDFADFKQGGDDDDDESPYEDYLGYGEQDSESREWREQMVSAIAPAAPSPAAGVHRSVRSDGR